MTTPVTNVRVNGVELDFTGIEYSISVSHGRSDVLAQSAPSSAQIILYGPTNTHVEIADELRSWCAGLDETPIEHRLEEGAPVDVLRRVADEIDASMIVIGRRGAGGRPDLLLGSTAHQLVERSDRPVLVVPPSDRG